jgi:hypothetical protein
MAINYNLAKVYALSDNDPEFVMQIITLFVTEVPEDMKQIELGIKEKDHKLAYAYAHKIKPTLDLLGMDISYEENLQIMTWTKTEGNRKEIKEVYKSLKDRIDLAIKEIKKDFKL